jgi:hypothetical protein
MTNLLVSLLDKTGIPIERLGDSTGTIVRFVAGSYVAIYLDGDFCSRAVVSPRPTAWTLQLIEASKQGMRPSHLCSEARRFERR